MRKEFRREGLGYAMNVPEIATEFGVDRLARSRGDMHGEITVMCALPGTRSSDGHLHTARFNLSSTRGRTELANTLRARSGADDVDWTDLLEDFCRRVLAAERVGEPVEFVGDRPQRIAPAWRLDPILPYDKPTILYGEGGTGKSTLATAIAVSVETGIAIIDGWIPRRAPVLYLDWETSADDVDEHVKGIARGAHIPDTVRIRYRRCYGPLTEQTDEIARLVASEGIGLLIVDSVGLAGGQSSDGADISDSAIRLFSAFRSIGTTVLAVDHVSKGDASDPNRPARPYGSIYKTNLARATFELRRSSTSGEVARIGVFNTKSNVRRLLPPIGLAVAQADDGTISYGSFDVAADHELGRKAPLWQRALALLEEGDMSEEELAEALDAKARSLNAVLNDMARQSGTVERLPSSKKWHRVHRVS